MNPLFVRLGLQSQEYIKGMQNAQQQAKQFEGEMKSVNQTMETFKKVGMALGVSFSLYKIVSETKDLIEESTLLASRYTSLNVVLDNVGKNTGHTSSEMTAYAEALRKTGISAIESRQTLIRMTQANIDLEKSTGLARIAQDAAVIGQINSSEAFSRMIYGIQSAQVEILRTIGINVNFENSYKTLAKELGKTTAELSEQEKMQARVNVVMQAGETISGTYEAAMGTAGKQLSSMTRYVEDFKVELGKAFEPAMITLISSATDAIKSLSKTVQDKEFQEGIKTLAQGFATLASGIMEAGTVAASFWVKMLAPSDVLQTQLTNINDQITKTEDRIKKAQGGLYGFGLLQDKNYINKLQQELELLNKQKEIVEQSIKSDKTGFFNRPSYQSDWDAINQEIPLPKIPSPPQAAKPDKKLITPDKILEMTFSSYDQLKKEDAEYWAWENKQKEEAAQEWQDLKDYTAKATKEGYDKLAKEDTEYWEWHYGEIQKDYDEQKKADLKVIEDSKKLASEKADAYKTMYGDMKGDAKVYYDYQLDALNKQHENYEKLIGKNAVTDAWYARQKKQLDQQLTLSGNNFFKGIKVGYEQSLESATTLAKTGEAVFQSFTRETSNMLSDNFFNIFTGRMDDLELDWGRMWNGMARTASDHLAQIATGKAIDAAISGVDWLGTAMGWWAAGSWDIKKDQMAILHKGEMVIPADVADRMRTGSDASLGEAFPSDIGGFKEGSIGYAGGLAALESLASSARAFGVKSAVGLAMGVPFSINPVGLIGMLGLATAKGLYDAYNAWAADVTDPFSGFLGSLGGMGDGDTGGYGGSLGTDPGDPEGGGPGLGGSVAHKGMRIGLRNDEGFLIAQRGEEVVTEKNLNRLEKILSSGGSGVGRQPVQIIFENRGVITTNDVDTWLADRLQRLNDYRTGAGVTQRRSVTAGVSL